MKMVLFQMLLHRGTGKLCCLLTHSVMVVELWSCAAVQKGRIRFWHQEPVLKKEIKLLKSIQNMINDGNKMLEVKIPCILFLKFITQ